MAPEVVGSNPISHPFFMLSKIHQANFFLKLFGITKIPLIFFCRPKIIEFDSSTIRVRIKLNRRTRNHLRSMYFGTLAVGADIPAGFFAMQKIQASGSKIALIFKDFKADFLKRPEGDVIFSCSQGSDIENLVKEAIKTGDRVDMPIFVEASVPSIADDVVAKFELTLSLKKKR